MWGLRYIDDLVLRDRDTDGNGSLDERLYALQDANWNVTAVTNASGAVQERYAYSAYGVPIFLDASFAGASSSYQWETLFAGYRWDQNVGYNVKSWYLNPVLGNWLNGPNFESYNNPMTGFSAETREMYFGDSYLPDSVMQTATLHTPDFVAGSGV